MAAPNPNASATPKQLEQIHRLLEKRSQDVNEIADTIAGQLRAHEKYKLRIAHVRKELLESPTDTVSVTWILAELSTAETLFREALPKGLEPQ